jgi:hypothetical protein
MDGQGVVKRKVQVARGDFIGMNTEGRLFDDGENKREICILGGYEWL